MATQMNTYDMVGVKENISNVISNISPTKTPFQSAIGNEKVTQRTHQWQEDSLDAAAVNARVEGADASDKTLTPTTMRSNTTQILTKTVNITGTAEATDSYGRDKELAYQLTKASKEIKRDLERAMIGVSQAAVTGDSSTARKMASYDQMIASANNTITDSDTGTGGNQAGPLTEANLLTNHQAIYDAGGDATILMVKPADAKLIAAFTSASGRFRDFGQDKKLVNAVDLLVTPFGELRVVINRWVLSTTALLFDPSNWKQLVLRPWFRETLAKTGDSTRVMICGEFSLKHVNRSASGIITNLS